MRGMQSMTDNSDRRVVCDGSSKRPRDGMWLLDVLLEDFLKEGCPAYANSELPIAFKQLEQNSSFAVKINRVSQMIEDAGRRSQMPSMWYRIQGGSDGEG